MDKKMFGELMTGAKQMRDHAAGKKIAGFRELVSEVKPPRPLGKEDIIKLREKLRVSQAAFALLLNTSAATVRAWEQGVNTPSGSTLRLLAIARKNPKALYTV
jgi:putative transcriptional regulator